MDELSRDLAASLVSRSYVDQARCAVNKRENLVLTLLSQKRLPERGWNDATIEHFVQEAAFMDSNNFLGNVGVGEREARVACSLVARRHYGMAHGVGRSGDIAAVQPKAAGSSMLAKLTNFLVKDALRIAGMMDISAATVLPLATGMALTSTLLAISSTRPASARYVLWPRIDQKTCAKCVTAAGMELIVVPNILEGDQLRTDLQKLRTEIRRLGPDQIVAVLSTTSCFAPRGADRLVEIAKLCKEQEVAHIVNNAYGVQAKQICDLITSAWRKGRVDAVVQSTDKNFMVPVGGSVVAAGPGKSMVVDAVNAAYPGRASAAPMLDVFMTLLHWGASGWRRVLQDREELWEDAKAMLETFAASHGCRVLVTPDNPISLGVTLDSLLDDAVTSSACSNTLKRVPSASDSQAAADSQEGSIGQEQKPVAEGYVQISDGMSSDSDRDGRDDQLPSTFLGSMLFRRLVSGTRVVARGKSQQVAGQDFKGYGAHYDMYPHDYLTMAVALGTTLEDVELFLARLADCFEEFRRRRKSR